MSPQRPQRKGPTGGKVSLEGKALRLPPSNVRFAPCLPFSDMRPVTNGAYPLGTPTDVRGDKSAERGRTGTHHDRTHPKKIIVIIMENGMLTFFIFSLCLKPCFWYNANSIKEERKCTM